MAEIYEVRLRKDAEKEIPTVGRQYDSEEIPQQSKPSQNNDILKTASATMIFATAEAGKVVNSVTSIQGNSDMTAKVKTATNVALRGVTILGGAIAGGPLGIALSAGALIDTAVDVGIGAYERSFNREVLDIETRLNIQRRGYINIGR